MLQLKKIIKEYGSGENKVTALNGVDITFRENEFVAILGHSGCGKTTLLNIIGGLDHYTSGDLVINGVSTKKYKDRDWDAYRNHSIGFIFQSYNLIPHQTVLSNVELALTISGVSKSERRKRAKEALEKVGLGDQIHKKPNQMSGGQMQRVAIARALINNPDILLADEPTGALDSETSIQVMELLKEIAKDKLVIMVTHNPELAEQYATRIVRIKDGQLTSDSAPFVPEKVDAPVEAKKKRVSMSFLTAVSLSLNNLLTKKGRTLLTAFAGSIGIIGIALILALSTGINEYIDGVQEETLASYPITIDRESTDSSEMIKIMFGDNEEIHREPGDPEDTVYAGTEMYDALNKMNSTAKRINNMAKFKEYVDSNKTIKDKAKAVSYSYSVKMPIFTKDDNGKIVKSDVNDMYAKAMGMQDAMNENSVYSGNNSMMSMWSINVWEELLPNDDGTDVNPLIKEQYDLISGTWPQNYNEVVVVLDENNQIPDMITYALGMKSADSFGDILKAAMKGEVINDYGRTKWSFSEIMDKEFKMILPCEYYEANADGRGYTDLTRNDTGLEVLYNNNNIGTMLKVVGFIRHNPDAKNSMIQGYIGYTKALTDYVIEKNRGSELLKQQLGDKENDLISGKKFKTDDYVGPDDKQKAESAKKYVVGLDTSHKAEVAKFVMSMPSDEELEAMLKEALKPENREQLFKDIAALAVPNEDGKGTTDSAAIVKALQGLTDEQFQQYAPDILRNILPYKYAADKAAELSDMTETELAASLDELNITDEAYVKIFDSFTPEEISEFSYDDILYKLGYADPDDPSKIRIYAKSFKDKDVIADEITAYNNSVEDEADEIHYTDFVKLLMSSVTNIITGISYLLIAFVGISLVVSSIMIGIITYISVLERTREIGILRAIGASKHDVSTVFNAETLLVGLTAGIIGIGVSMLLTLVINVIIHNVTKLDTLVAHVPVAGAVILILISMFLTFIAGLIPSRLAAKKDPVVALRTE